MTRTPLSRSKGQRSRSPGRFTHRGLNASGSCSGERGNILGVGNYCYLAVCSVALGASAPTEGGEGVMWQAPAYSLFYSAYKIVDDSGLTYYGRANNSDEKHFQIHDVVDELR